MTEQVNNMVIIGDSRLDAITPFQTSFSLQTSISTPTSTTTTAAQLAQRYNFFLETKYYSADIQLHLITESDLINYSLDPISPQSRVLASTLNQANCALVLFDTTNPGGFNLIKKLYTNAVHQLLTQVDTHIFAGCASKHGANPNATNCESTVPNVNGENWSKWQNYALDFNMQLIILNTLNFEPISYHSNVSDEVTSSPIDQLTVSEGSDSDIDPAELVELDPSELGTSALVSAISCCAWPSMLRKTQAKPNPQHVVKQIVKPETSPEETDSNNSSSQPTQAVFTTAPKPLMGVPLLPLDHVYRFDAESMAEYQSLNDDFDDFNYDDNEQSADRLALLDVLDGSFCDGAAADKANEIESSVQPHQSDNGGDAEENDVFEGFSVDPASTSNQINSETSISPQPETKPKTTKSTTKPPTKPKQATKSTTTKKKANKQTDVFASLESILSEASSLRHSTRSGPMNDTTRRTQATSIALRLAQSFAAFGDDDDEALFNSILTDDGFGLDMFGLMPGSDEATYPIDQLPLNNLKLDQILMNQVPIPDDVLMRDSVEENRDQDTEVTPTPQPPQ